MPLTFPGQRYIITWSEWDKSIEVGFYSLTETGLMNRVSTCDFLLQWHERDSFLKRLVTGNEIWISYQNVHRKRIWSKNNRSLTVAKLGLHLKKLSILSFIHFSSSFIHLVGLERSTMSSFLKVKLSILENITISLINWKIP